ncbi:MAG TPA: hypothetical protein VMV81_03055 [Phycisphaerae bacterium]|nr:hypothetical protein [Phycisphaerae bacterium]
MMQDVQANSAQPSLFHRVKWYHISGSVLVLIILTLAIYGWWTYRQIRNEISCKEQLGRGVWELVFADGKLSQATDLSSISKSPERIKCVCSGEPYVYRPFPEPVQMLGPTFRIIAWCPKPCHRGGRIVLLEYGGVEWLSEAKFQDAIKCNPIWDGYGSSVVQPQPAISR